MKAVTVDPYQEYLENPEKMRRTVYSLKDAVNELTPNVRKVLRYIARDSLDPNQPVSLVCDFIHRLDAYISKHEKDDHVRLSKAVRCNVVVCCDETSGEIYDKDLFDRVGQKMGKPEGGPGYLDMHKFIEELVEAGVLFRSQAPHSEAQYTLTPEATEALRVLNTIRAFPWSYPINIMPDGRTLITEKEKNSKAFPEYRKLFLELERQIIENDNPDLQLPFVSENSRGL